jgi:succinate dehydrogenase/fumarate reductase flavoprotein subunit
MFTYETDVLVIGGGGGGAMAAYEASKHGVEVAMVLKGSPQHCGVTIMAPGAISGVGNWHVPGDSVDLHFSPPQQNLWVDSGSGSRPNV